MNQHKIGQFIAMQRKAKKYTQKQLAEKLMISNRTISKWETGNGLPDVSLMVPLCELLDISVNELLAGQLLSTRQYYQKAEEHMVHLLNEQEKNRKKRRMAWLTLFMMIVTTIMIGIVIQYFIPKTSWMYWLYNIFLLVFIGSQLWIVLTLLSETELYQCTHCKKYFKATLKKILIDSLYMMRHKEMRLMYHTPWSRALRCPYCHTSDRFTRVLASAKEKTRRIS